MHEFVEECRGEWRRLGVPDPIANEMAADLTADIEEAVAEGGSAEDVVGESVFDPRRFAAAWAGARGVTNPPRADPTTRRRPVLAVVLIALFGLLTLITAAALFGRRSVSVAVSVRRILGPGAAHWFGQGPATHPQRVFVPGPPFDVGQPPGLMVAAAVLLLVGLLGMAAALWWWAPWSDRGDGRRLGWPGRP